MLFYDVYISKMCSIDIMLVVQIYKLSSKRSINYEIYIIYKNTNK